MGVDILPISPGDGKHLKENEETKVSRESDQRNVKNLLTKKLAAHVKIFFRNSVSHSLNNFSFIQGTTFPKQGQTAVVHYVGKLK